MRFNNMKNVGRKSWEVLERFLHFLLCNLLHIKLSQQGWENVLQFVRFGIVGLSNTVVGYLIYAVTLGLLQRYHVWPKADYFAAQVVMFLLSVLWSFYWNNKAVFQQEEGEKRNVFAALMKTYTTYAFTGLLLSEALLFLWVDTLHISKFAAPIINLLITVPLNFFLQKFWAFRKK